MLVYISSGLSAWSKAAADAGMREVHSLEAADFVIAESDEWPPLTKPVLYIGRNLSWNRTGRLGIRPAPGHELRPRRPMLPWKSDNTGCVMVLGESPRDVLQKWWENDTDHAAATEWKRMVLYRPHPHVHRAPPIEADLWARRAWLTISQRTYAAVDAVCMGIPGVTTDPASMAWDVTSHKIGERKMPDREAWAHWLSWTQFSPEEIGDGTALRHFMGAFDEAKADAAPKV